MGCHYVFILRKLSDSVNLQYNNVQTGHKVHLSAIMPKYHIKRSERINHQAYYIFYFPNVLPTDTG